MLLYGLQGQQEGDHGEVRRGLRGETWALCERGQDLGGADTHNLEWCGCGIAGFVLLRGGGGREAVELLFR